MDWAGTNPEAGYYYDAYISRDKCVLTAPQHVFGSYNEHAVCSANADLKYLEMSSTQKQAWEYVHDSVRGVLLIMPTLLGYTLSQLLFNQLPLTSKRRFLMEFLLVAVPTVLNQTVISDYDVLYSSVGAVVTVLLLWLAARRSRNSTRDYTYEVGKRPIVFTLLRASCYTSTCSAILAVDFTSFPVEYRKSQKYGASVMDTGIGLFVVTMAIVSHRAQHFRDLKKLFKVVAPLLVLGLARTLVVAMIDYHQDVREYGKHLNAFFTLGLTKLFGTLCSLLARSDKQLLPLGLGVLVLHELVLQLGLSDFVMSDADRNSFLSGNREGLSALPGCIALYLLTIYFAKWYMSWNKLYYTQLCSKLRFMLLFAALGWTMVSFCTWAFGIARVTFNSGYVFWIFSLSVTSLLLYTFLFEFVLQLVQKKTDSFSKIKSKMPTSALPVLVESINMNGLTYFMLSNFFTGFVNLTQAPSERSSPESVIILILYMLAGTSVIFVLFCKGIRIA